MIGRIREPYPTPSVLANIRCTRICSSRSWVTAFYCLPKLLNNNFRYGQSWSESLAVAVSVRFLCFSLRSSLTVRRNSFRITPLSSAQSPYIPIPWFSFRFALFLEHRQADRIPISLPKHQNIMPKQYSDAIYATLPIKNIRAYIKHTQQTHL